MMEECYNDKHGYCKYRHQCEKKHYEDICRDKNKCRNPRTPGDVKCQKKKVPVGPTTNTKAETETMMKEIVRVTKDRKTEHRMKYLKTE